ncbi:MAG: porin [Acidobacteriota bacterium]
MSEVRAELRSLRVTLESQQRTIEALEARLARCSEPQPAEPVLTTSPFTPESARLRYQSADGETTAELGGYAQLDYRGYRTGAHLPSTFLIRRARTGIEGRLDRNFDYAILADFADTNGTILRDFRVRFSRYPAAQITVGQFKAPFSQEELRADIAQDFAERSMANTVAPSRSPGVMLSGEIAGGRATYEIGAFNGKGLLANNTVSTPESVLRLRFSPWSRTDGSRLQQLSFGGALARGRNAIGANGVRGQSESRSPSFYDPDKVGGPLTRRNVEATWLSGALAIRGEYDLLEQAREGVGPGGTNLTSITARGLTAQVTYLLTGESKPDSKPVSPLHAFPGGLGAWELKARYARLRLDGEASKSNGARSFTSGVNWYPNSYLAWLLDVGMERLDDPFLAVGSSSRDSFVILSRIQLAF